MTNAMFTVKLFLPDFLHVSEIRCSQQFTTGQQPSVFNIRLLDQWDGCCAPYLSLHRLYEWMIHLDIVFVSNVNSLLKCLLHIDLLNALDLSKY